MGFVVLLGGGFWAGRWAQICAESGLEWKLFVSFAPRMGADFLRLDYLEGR